MNTNLEQKFFTEVKGWGEASDGYPWYSPGGGRYFELPPISTSWDAFHKWVVPELKNIVENSIQDELLSMKIGEFMWSNKTPQRALEWAMEGLGHG